MLKIVNKKIWDRQIEALSDAYGEIIKRNEKIATLEKENLGLKELLSEEAKKLSTVIEEFNNFKISVQKEREKKLKETLSTKKKWLKAEYGEDYGK